MDDQLKKHFETLRDEDAESLPSYTQVLTSVRASSNTRAGSPWFQVALPAFAAVIVVLWLAIPRQTPVESAAPQQFAPVRWAMPTDVLLSTPGSEFLRDVPAFGTKALLSDPLLGPDSNWGSRG